MNWWNVIKSTPRSRREKKEQQKWLEDFTNEINQKYKFTEPDGLNDTTDAWGDPLRHGNYGDTFNESDLASRRHKLGLQHDFNNQEVKHGDSRTQRRDRVRAIADSLPKEHGVARRNIRFTDATNSGGANDEPTRGREFDEEAGSEQPTLNVEHSRSMHHTPMNDDGEPGWSEGLRPKDVDNSDSRHPLDPNYWRWNSVDREDNKLPKEAQTAIDTQNQRRKDNWDKDLWVNTPFGQKREWD